MKKSSYSTTLTTSEHDGQRNLNGGVLSAGNFDLVVQNGHIAEPSVLGRTSPSAKGMISSSGSETSGSSSMDAASIAAIDACDLLIDQRRVIIANSAKKYPPNIKDKLVELLILCPVGREIPAGATGSSWT